MSHNDFSFIVIVSFKGDLLFYRHIKEEFEDGLFQDEELKVIIKEGLFLLLF